MTLAPKKFLTLDELEKLRLAVLAPKEKPTQEALPPANWDRAIRLVEKHPTLKVLVDNMRKYSDGK